ncbi:hypothetical protein MKEN_01111500 [Mycena kentingensis (nom. inval.)]|nr:hypothetical protein MKEN_01111500 [Mycena kentingensis (nom. inval.)]
MPSTTLTLLPLVLAAVASAASIESRQNTDGLATFCFGDGNCFQATASDSAGCVDLPLFSENFVSAAVDAPGLECILSPERSCVGSAFLPPFVVSGQGTVALSSLSPALPTVASFLCTSAAETINFCFSDTTLGCFQASTITNGCSSLPSLTPTFGSVSYTAGGSCTLFDGEECTGNSAPFAGDAFTSAELSTLGLDNVVSFSCTA